MLLRSFILSLSVFLLSGSRLTCPIAPNIRPGKDFALFFAVENYTQWSSLSYPIDDAEAIAALLESEYGFETEIIRDATYEQMDAALRRYIGRSYDPDAQLLVFCSGHGDFDPVLKEGFFIPSNGGNNLQDKGFSYLRMQNYLNRVPCNHTLLAIDACYSGTFDPSLAMRGQPKSGRPGTSPNRRLTFVDEELRLNTRLFMASGRKEPTPDRSNFAAYFQRALRQRGGDDGILSYRELTAELEKARPKPYFSAFEGNQEESNFLFVARKVGKPEPEVTEDKVWQTAVQRNSWESYAFYLQLYPVGRYAEQARQKQREKESAPYDSTSKLNKTPFVTSVAAPVRAGEMVYIKGGTFSMGDQFNEGDLNEKPLHNVTVADFYLCKTEVNFAEYDQFCTSTGRSRYGGSGQGNYPANAMSWYDAVAYCNWRSQKENLIPCYTIKGKEVSCDWSANGYRLPTEAEWEYAARAGISSNGEAKGGEKIRFGNGKNIADAGEINFKGDEMWKHDCVIMGANRNKTTPVGSFQPNCLGLFDMSGNVAEWCWDAYSSDFYKNSPTNNPVGPTFGSGRVLRGGSYNLSPGLCRTSTRWNDLPESQYTNFGFRLAMTATD